MKHQVHVSCWQVRVAMEGLPDVLPVPGGGGKTGGLPERRRSDTYTHMKTTVEISDPLLAAARKLAAKKGTTVRALVQEGLRRVIEASRQGGRFKLRDRSWGSGGLRPEFRGASWEQIRDASFEGRGT